MNTKKINGTHFEKMLQNGLANLCKFENELNNLNVFPVADGDTGTNMRTTLECGLRKAKSTPASGAYLKSLSDAMLFGAHGNSGVILSQIFRGIFLSLSHCGNVNPGELRNALIMGYKTAYSAVVRPVEGTILTVAREGIEHIRTQISRTTTFEDLLSMYVAEMKKSLSHTPDILPQLKEAGVVDSGALGYIVIIEGMLSYLFGDTIPVNSAFQKEKPVVREESTNPSLFNENSLFEDGYCVEFVLQLMKGEEYLQHFSLKRYISDLQDSGNSIVAVQNGTRIKVHVHTFKPAKILWLSQEYGEFVSCKVENMQIQHNSAINEFTDSKKRKAFSIISVSDCSTIQEIFNDLGSSSVICNSKMDVSVNDFINALIEENAETAVILPNNANLLYVAKQAKELFKESDIIILETKSIPEGYCALALGNPDESDINRRIKQMQFGFSDVSTLSVTTAGKEYHAENVDCMPGMQIAILDGKVVCSGDEALNVFCNGIKSIPNIDEKESCIVFRGEKIDAAIETACENLIHSIFPNLEISFIYSGSQLYAWSAAIS